MIKPVGLRDGQVIDGGEARLHETVGIKLPVLATVVPFIGIAYGNAVLMPYQSSLIKRGNHHIHRFLSKAEFAVGETGENNREGSGFGWSRRSAARSSLRPLPKWSWSNQTTISTVAPRIVVAC